MLVEGSVAISSSDEAGGRPKHIRTMTVPTYFGELGILEQIPRTANVTAIGDCRCALVDGATLLDALAAASPPSAFVGGAPAEAQGAGVVVVVVRTGATQF